MVDIAIVAARRPLFTRSTYAVISLIYQRKFSYRDFSKFLHSGRVHILNIPDSRYSMSNGNSAEMEQVVHTSNIVPEQLVN